MEQKYYVSTELEGQLKEPVYNDNGDIIAYCVSRSFSMRISKDIYDNLSEEEKGKYIEEPSNN